MLQSQDHRPVFAPEAWPDERVEQAAYSGRGKRNPQFPFSKTPFVLQARDPVTYCKYHDVVPEADPERFYADPDLAFYID